MRKVRFSEKFVGGQLSPGRYSGPNGLVLRVRRSGRRYWEQRITVNGRRLNVGVGSHPVVGVARAHQIALQNLVLVGRGEHPLQALLLRPPTFGDAARKVIARRYDRHGLYLRVQPTGRRYWEQRYAFRGKRKTTGIGPYPAVGLRAARDKALENLRLVAKGEDPAPERDCTPVPTLKAALPRVIALHRVRWTNSRQPTIWQRSFEMHVYPHLADKLVSEIDSADLLAVLKPIWESHHDTARRLRQRLSTIMKWAIVQRYRTDSPAEAVLEALPKSSASSVHYQALPHAQVCAALALVRACDALLATRLAFEFLVLTATRSGEVRGARWEEVHLDEALWTVPASRMKSRKPHRVPLSGPALAVLREARERLSAAEFVFPSPRGKPLSDSTISALVRTLQIRAVPHGFRSSFRDWCGESGVAREVAEACLAHVVANKVEAAYARSDLFARRVPVMEDWAQYVTAGLGPWALIDGDPGGRS